MKPIKVLVITGLSGSGKSTAARALEDAGYFVIDNLPLALLPDCLTIARDENRRMEQVAVVVDVRNRQFLDEAHTLLEKVRAGGDQVDILFFTASDDALGRRYSETRRKHPLAPQGSVLEGISRERTMLRELCKAATIVFDSTGLNVHQLKQRVMNYVENGEVEWPLVVHVESFGFRHGLPLNADVVLDVRFMPNPYYQDDLRGLRGTDTAVQEFVYGQPACQEFLGHLRAMFTFLIPQYRKEGKNYLTIAFGCTGGHHRSVALAEYMRKMLNTPGIELSVVHRDIDKR